MPQDLVRVFVLPPSTRELERRLKTRAQDSAAEVALRMARAADEMCHWAEYDYVIVNHGIEVSVRRVQAILTRSEEHTSELQSILRIWYVGFFLQHQSSTSHVNSLT